MEQVRSFIAVELPDEVRNGLASLQGELKLDQSRWVKRVDPYGIHLTLKFLGNVAFNRLDGIVRAMEVAVKGVSPFYLEVSGLGVFPNPRRVQVVWVGVGGEIEKLNRLQRNIESNMVPLGFVAESRRFTPHLTLARLRDHTPVEERQNIGQQITGARFEMAYTIEVVAVNLMKSQLTRDGAIYSRINSVSLK